MARGGAGGVRVGMVINLIILSCILWLNLGPIKLGPDTWRFERWPLLLLLLLLVMMMNHAARGRGEIVLN